MLYEVQDLQLSIITHTAISHLRLKNKTTPLDQATIEAAILMNQMLSSDEVQDLQTEATVMSAAAILMKMKLSSDEVQESQIEAAQATQATQATQAMGEAAAILMKMKNQILSSDEVQDSQTAMSEAAMSAAAILMKMKSQRF